MGDKYDSPIEDIFESCQEERYQAFLLLGHKGCGKSTELNRLSAALVSKGYPVKTIVCSMDLDMFNIVYSDLFILMGEALLEIAKDCGCTVSKKILDAIRHFWDKRTETLVLSREENTDIEAGASAETPGTYFITMRQFFPGCRFRSYIRSQSGFPTMPDLRRWKVILRPKHCP